jgi:2-polyprenyl-3-methyl-5-hydroxy-6-metoxy-1,4-benzoquinol methylase
LGSQTSEIGAVKPNWFVTFEPKRLEYYRGQLIHADTGLHDQAARLVRQLAEPGSSVVDVGAGAGAFASRLVDMGYSVTALDAEEAEFDCPGVPFHQVDLNRDHLTGLVPSQFDVACCLEVIEHVENPWQLLRSIHSVVRPGGKLVLSTPNTTSFLSRLLFLRSGRFHQFQDEDLVYGHVSPISNFELSQIAARSGWRILEVQPAGYLPVFDLSRVSPRNLILNALRGLAYVVSTGQKRGWALLYAMQRVEAG